MGGKRANRDARGQGYLWGAARVRASRTRPIPRFSPQRWPQIHRRGKEDSPSARSSPTVPKDRSDYGARATEPYGGLRLVAVIGALSGIEGCCCAGVAAEGSLSGFQRRAQPGLSSAVRGRQRRQQRVEDGSGMLLRGRARGGHGRRFLSQTIVRPALMTAALASADSSAHRGQPEPRGCPWKQVCSKGRGLWGSSP